MTLDTIMIFAAGRGTRMGRLTDGCPKPLLPVLGKPLIDRALDIADAAGIARKIINTHYLGHMLAAHLRARPDVTIINETPEALETGGGLKNARATLGEGPVFTLNPDAVWCGENPLAHLATNWQPEKMEALLMLVPLEKATGHKGAGDFVINRHGQLQRYAGQGVPHVYASAEIIRPSRVMEIAKKRFSLNTVWDRLIARRQLFGCVHSGDWIDVGTPEGIKLAEAMLKEGANV